jgi:hypothetical protein
MRTTIIPRASPFHEFSCGVTIQYSPPPPVGAGSGRIPRDAGEGGKNQGRDKRHSSAGGVVSADEPEPADEPEDRQSSSPANGRPDERHSRMATDQGGIHVARLSESGRRHLALDNRPMLLIYLS